jgi:alkanesulfonate monooxygenase
MLRDMISTPIELFSTCPASSGVSQASYLQNVVDVARWSEEWGCRGILVYTDNSLVDPWLVSHVIIQNTKSLCPLVAVQPIYMHPYTVAKMVASLGHLYRRRIYLNMVAGGFKNDLTALNDTTPHDKRYQRLIEYTTIVKQLLAGPAPVTFEGDFYKVDKLKLSPPLPPDLFPGLFVSGSSEEGLAAAKAIGAPAVMYPKPAGTYQRAAVDPTLTSGIRVGIISREWEDDAWQVAHARFPEDRKGQLARQLATKISDSVWHKQLSQTDGTIEARSPYWLVPFENYKTMCPYLVGSYDRVAAELATYIAAGYRTCILDVPPDPGELRHINIAFGRAVEVAECQSYCKTG